MVNLTNGQWSTLYNVFSFGLISMLACTVYTLVSQARVLPKYRNALVLSSMVTFIAAYHYWRTEPGVAAPQEALAPVIRAAHGIARIAEFTGRTTPDVVT